MQSLYKKVDKAQKSYYLKRKFKDMVRNAYSMIWLLIIIGGLIVLGYFGFIYLEGIPQKVMDSIGWGENSGQEKPVAPDGMVPDPSLPQNPPPEP